jgi:hypothetical protein
VDGLFVAVLLEFGKRALFSFFESELEDDEQEQHRG